MLRRTGQQHAEQQSLKLCCFQDFTVIDNPKKSSWYVL